MRKIRRSPRANIKERIQEARARSIYLLPNSFTMGSLICAFWGVTQAMAGEFGVAAATIFLSMLWTAWTAVWRVSRIHKAVSVNSLTPSLT